MENWNKRFFLAAAVCGGFCLATVGNSHADEERESWQVISADLDRREVKRVAIDTENFEIGPYIGMLAIQDFDASVLYGLRASWHITEDFFFEGSYASSEGDLTSYEKLSGGAPLFEDSERDYTFYNINFGWNALPGEIFILGNYALKSDLYFIGGAGNTDFLGDNFFTLTIGAGYRILLSDSLAWRLDVRDHIFDRDAFGNSETTNNIELSTGITYYF